ncbi:hypothetical protein BJI67_06315 [Acidihalobacter aeolianus]|uniref:Phosphatidate cytidylyltransferase n=1 Tax=Acidihalobacter aeolianus TaxID=2792603 RepID=A0A1D8K6X5_9GAMM|nr:phosphatidate cytidylyltransferase [Acidihalobacter aeolianus]AOV16727.1 hypothetical protein BJI67_06315 [Acidihalobacter aeolianus]
MFKQRLITGLLLGGATLAGIFILPNAAFGLLVLLTFLIGADEWVRLTGGDSPVLRAGFLAGVTLTAGLAWWVASDGDLRIPLVIGLLWWVLASCLILFYRPGGRTWEGDGTRLALRAALLPALVPAWLAIVWLQRYDSGLLVFLIVLAAVGDSAAYLAGKRFGRHRMAPRLSPGKTWEGLMGEVLVSLLLAAAGAWYFVAGDVWLRLSFVGLCMLTIFASVVGDLFESLLKRLAGAKDSGSLLPGHGGVLDRFDSHLAAAPVFLMGWIWWLRGGGL